MGATMTGMARHGGVLPVGGTFFVFSDYMRPAVRLAALSESHVIYSWTHDSVGLGEDGPTHQPVEHLASLRAMPGTARDPPRRRQRDRPRVADRGGLRRAHRAGAVAPVRPCPRRHRRGRRGRGSGRLRARGTGRGRPRSSSSAPARRCRCAWRRRACWPVPAAAAAPRATGVSGPGWCRCRAGSSSPCRPESYRHAVLPPGIRASPSRRPPRSAGSATPTTWWPSTTSGRRPRAKRCSSTSGTRPTTWPPGPGRSWPGPVVPGALTRTHRRSTPGPEASVRREGSTMTKLHDLYEQQGQSPWLDNLRRDYLRGGRLAELVDEGIRGVTSNPTIFAKAIEGGNDYDEQFRRPAGLAHRRGGVLGARHHATSATPWPSCAPVHDELRRRRRLRVVGGGPEPGP